MQTVFLLLCHDHISLYEGGSLDKKYVNGDDRVCFSGSQLRDDLKKMAADLCNEANVDSEDDFTFVLLENEDPQLNESVKSCLKIGSSVPVRQLLEETIAVLSKEPDLKVDLYGLNFDGRSYLVSGKGIESAPFSLLAHTIGDDELIASAREMLSTSSMKDKILRKLAK